MWYWTKGSMAFARRTLSHFATGGMGRAAMDTYEPIDQAALCFSSKRRFNIARIDSEMAFGFLKRDPLQKRGAFAGFDFFCLQNNCSVRFHGN